MLPVVNQEWLLASVVLVLLNLVPFFEILPFLAANIVVTNPHALDLQGTVHVQRCIRGNVITPFG